MKSARKRSRSSSRTASLSSDDDREAYVCDCDSSTATRKTTAGEVILCRKCLNSQHRACWSTGEKLEGYPHPLCNRCQQHALEQIVEDRRVQIDRAAKMLGNKRNETEELYRTGLWEYYCALPTPTDISLPPGFHHATATTLHKSRTIPLHPAPEAWLDELLANVHAMLDAAGGEFAVVDDGDVAEGNGTRAERVVRSWRDVAVWLIQEGPWRGERGRLGVLGEVVGLVEKGKFAGRWVEEDVQEGEVVVEDGVVESIENGDGGANVRVAASKQGRKGDGSKGKGKGVVKIEQEEEESSYWGESKGRVISRVTNEVGQFQVWRPESWHKDVNKSGKKRDA